MSSVQLRPWFAIETAPEDVVVETRIDDYQGIRNSQTLKRSGRLWFVPDGSTYVYYAPTHWRHVAEGGDA